MTAPTLDDRTHGAARALGARLRDIRRQQGLSLADVQTRSGGEWKAVVVGAYERGERSVTIERLARLAAFYGVPLPDLLPARVDPAGTDAEVVSPPGADRVILDLTALDPEDGRIAPVTRFVRRIQRLRGDHNGRVLTLRGDDLSLLALAVGTSPEDLRDDLAAREVLR